MDYHVHVPTHDAESAAEQNNFVFVRGRRRKQRQSGELKKKKKKKGEPDRLKALSELSTGNPLSFATVVLS
jgi:hypothetical protein